MNPKSGDLIETTSQAYKVRIVTINTPFNPGNKMETWLLLEQTGVRFSLHRIPTWIFLAMHLRTFEKTQIDLVGNNPPLNWRLLAEV